MAGTMDTAATGNFKNYAGGVTWYVVWASIVAGMGGTLFGYDLGITGGVTAMVPFLRLFFPTVAAQVLSGGSTSTNAYCMYADQGLQAFTSSLFLAAAFAALAGSWSTRRHGRRATMLLGGVCFLLGATLTSTATHLPQLVIGRIVLGLGVGLAARSVPLYLSEIAPVGSRGALNIMFQLSITFGILVAQLVNLGTQHMAGDAGWRTSLGLAGVLALILTFGALFLPETPNSLVERGHTSKARSVLCRIRGTDDISAELDDITAAAAAAKLVTRPWRTLLSKEYRPELVVTFFLPILQQLTGINSIMFYAPVIFATVSPANGALLSTVVTGAINVVATFLAIATALFLAGGFQMLAAEVTMAALLGVFFHGAVGDHVPADVGVGILVVVCVFVAGFAYSWGPLGWLVPSEVLSLETRSAGFSLVTCMNFLVTFVIGQSFLSMLCAFKFGIFLFFAGWVLLMTLFVVLLVPETKHVPMEEVHLIWANHFIWKKWALRYPRCSEVVKPGDAQQV